LPAINLPAGALRLTTLICKATPTEPTYIAGHSLDGTPREPYHQPIEISIEFSSMATRFTIHWRKRRIE
jgi:hypothetical protein